ncbi:MAG: glycoside hydrolase family 9 protein [Ruminococcus sp.]|nr:glycoside hydrolase family 9 protein [Ruminococcus sp.]
MKFRKLKSMLVSSAVALSSLAAPFTAAVSPSLTANAADGDNYAKLLQYSLYFYDANMCGDQVETNSRLTWRGNCHTSDEVPGGYHDAGDHAMFGQPQGYSASTLGWAYYEFKDAFEATGQSAHYKTIADHFAKFFRDATVLNGDSVSKVLIEKGEGGIDHSYWGPPEQQGNRGRMLWTSDGAANITAEYAAALAANYVNFGNPDDLKYAKALYNFAKQHQGSYSCEFYGNESTADEIGWAACWLYLATKDSAYKSDVDAIGTAYWVHCWENVSLGAAMLKGEITGDWGAANYLGELSGDGYKFIDSWGSARHNATAQMCALVAAKYNKGNADWAKGQMQYLTGDKAFANGQTHCLVVGFKPDASSKPHHRAASGTDTAESDGTPSKYVLVGALCGGPTDANGTYQDLRSDYKANEVAIDYNAGFVGAAAGLYYHYKTGTADPVSAIPGVKGGSTDGPAQGGTTTPAVTTTTTTVNGGGNTTTTTTTTKPSVTTTTTISGSTSGGKTLLPADMTVDTEEGDDGGINNYAEFKPQGAKKATLYLKVNSNDTEVSGAFGTWNGKWVQEDFTGVKVGVDKTVAIDYDIPSDVGQTVKAMVFWPHGNGVTIEKVVLDGGSSTSGNTTTRGTTTTAPKTTQGNTTTTTKGGTSSGDTVLLPADMTVDTEEGDDGGINNYAEFKPQGAKSATLYLKVNSNDTEVSGAFGTWNGKWVQEDFTGVKVGSDKTVSIDYTIPSDVGQTVKAMVFWPHGNGVTIEKVVLHGAGSSSNTTTKATTTTTRTTTTTTKTTTTTTKATTTTTTTTKAPTTPTTTTTQGTKTATLVGDANCDGKVSVADAVMIMQALANPSAYGLQGSNPNHITEQGWANADCQSSPGVTNKDALAVQMYTLGLVTSLPTDK